MRCPSCAHENPDDANFCGRCGSALREAERPCPTCGRANAADLQYCRACGASLTAGETHLSSPSRVARGRYVVRGFLGEGARKRVYRAHDTLLDRDVAIALVKTEGLDESGRLRVRREAQAMARLGDHPHVVTVHDIGEENGEPYIVSQYMAGGALAGLLRSAPEGRLELATALRIAEGVCGALEHAHRHGVVHRDLKPANVWLTEDGTAKLGDFGLAFSVRSSRVTRTGAIVGTVAYMAPEQALGHQPGPAADLYSLGALLYEMVTGRPPFIGDDVVSVISQHQNSEPVAPSWHVPGLPQDLERLILDLLEKSPEQRPPDATEVHARLASIDGSPAREPATQLRRDGEDGNQMAALAEGVFVGREQEVDRLRSALEDALDGRGRFVALVGEPGIGKTRTAQELTTYAGLRGAQVLIGRAFEGEGAPAYWPWVQMARAYIQERDADQVAGEMGAGAGDIAQVLSEVRDLVPGIVTPPALDAEQARFRFFDSVTTFLRNAARKQPLVLVLDDLHWADAPSLRLLRFLARELADSSLFVLGTYRDVELGRRHPLSQTLAELAREGLVERVVLRGLAEQEVERYIEVTAGIQPPPRLVAAVYEETDGNPFFVSEIVNLLASEGALDRAAELDRFTVTIPQGVREVVGRRLDLLSEDCNRLLATASAIGREFGVEVLERVAELDRDRTLELLEEAAGQRIVSEVRGPVPKFTFSHALVRDALYDELGVTRRVRLHRRIAETIEELAGEDRRPHLEELARHFLEAQDLERAIDYSEAAADRAVEMMAWEEAATLYDQARQALEVHAPAASRRRCELTLAVGRSLTRAGDVLHAKDEYERAVALVRDLDDPELLAQAAEGRSAWLEIGVVEEDVIALIEEALERLDASDSAQRARLLARYAMAVHFHSVGQRTKAALEAIAMARRLGDPATLAMVLNSSQLALRGPENLTERLAVDRELVTAAELAGDPELAVEGRGLWLTDLLEAGDIDGVRRELEAYSAGAETLRQPQYIRFALIRRAMLETLAGRFAEAEQLLEELRSPRVSRHELEPNVLQGMGVVLFWLRRHTGDLTGMADELARFAEQYPAVPAWRAALARMLLEEGRVEEARTEFEGVVGAAGDALPRDANWLVGMSLLAEVGSALGDRERSAHLYSQLAPYEDRVVVAGPGWSCSGTVARFLGILAASRGEYDRAERHFAAALAGNGRLGARPFVALTAIDHAEMLVRRREEDDAERAERLIGEALEDARELGMKRLVERAFELRVQLQGLESADVSSSIDMVAAEVEDERPDLRAHSAPDGTVTILFSDIERSTELNERLGDRRFFRVLAEHNSIVRSHVRDHEGFEVKAQGDGFMIVFAEPRRAVECAAAIQRALAAREQDGGERVRVRMGLHTGEAIRERDDFFGRNVVVAARIAASAAGGEVLVSSQLRELADGTDGVSFGEPRELDLKGLSGSHRVHAVDWEAAGAGAR